MKNLYLEIRFGTADYKFIVGLRPLDWKWQHDGGGRRYRNGQVGPLVYSWSIF